MTHAFTPTFVRTGIFSLLLAVGFPLYAQVNRYTHPLNPNGYATDERREYPFAVTGAGFAVLSGLCFLSAALVNTDRRNSDPPAYRS